jgi:hypothetical protein
LNNIMSPCVLPTASGEKIIFAECIRQLLLVNPKTC